MLAGIIIALILSLLVQSNSLQIDNGDANLEISANEDGTAGLTLTLAGEEKISGRISYGRNIDVGDCSSDVKCVLQADDATLTIETVDNGFSFSWVSTNTETVLQDCLDLKSGEINWFGGPEKWTQDWPVETSKFVNRPYTSIKTDNGAVSERYWLNSKGGYIFVQDRVPLFLDQNNLEEDRICFLGKLEDPYVGRNEVVLEYVLVVAENAREAQLHAVNNYLGKASGHPDEWIIRNPIWTTWAKYKKDINDDVVVEFATDIADKGFTGQIEIDDYWETCYGDLTFNDQQFADINNTVQTLKDLGFTVSLWTHPFVNHNCEQTMTYGGQNGFFVKSITGDDQTTWWDGNPAHYIDFTNEDAANWFVERLQLLQQLHGIDSFKFDAGESDYPPLDPVLTTGDVELSPGLITTEYVKTCARFGGLIEVRSGWRTQNLPIFVRMLDKDSRWNNNNGLASLITTLLQLNIIGYVLVLPDMIGGNGYGELPTAELIARWTQANTFMPTMQFSFLPWDITSDQFDGEAIIKKFVDLHGEYADDILAAMDNSVKTGTPVNPPVWWVDPTNPDAFKINDEYLLGENILVAPVIEEGASSRNVFLPSGSWKDGNDGTVYEGPQTLQNYAAPIDVLPYFIKQ